MKAVECSVSVASPLARQFVKESWRAILFMLLMPQIYGLFLIRQSLILQNDPYHAMKAAILDDEAAAFTG